MSVNKNNIVVSEKEPKDLHSIWVHHSKYNDLSSPITISVYSMGKWAPITTNSSDSGHLQEEIDDLEFSLQGKEDKSNKVNSLSNASTDTEYPSAKCVYDIVGNVESLLAQI